MSQRYLYGLGQPTIPNVWEVYSNIPKKSNLISFTKQWENCHRSIKSGQLLTISSNEKITKTLLGLRCWLLVFSWHKKCFMKIGSFQVNCSPILSREKKREEGGLKNENESGEIPRKIFFVHPDLIVFLSRLMD
jgi:hypothetical protein